MMMMIIIIILDFVSQDGELDCRWRIRGQLANPGSPKKRPCVCVCVVYSKLLGTELQLLDF